MFFYIFHFYASKAFEANITSIVAGDHEDKYGIEIKTVYKVKQYFVFILLLYIEIN